jgi:hypothetical protein
MPIEFTCPECRQRVRVSEALAGLNARCPNCTAGVSVPESSSPEPTAVTQHPPDTGPRDAWEPARTRWADDQPGREDYAFLRRDVDDSGWQVVRYALTLEYIAMVIMVCAYAGMLLMQCVAGMANPGAGPGGGQGALLFVGCLALVLALGILGAFILMIVGRCMACLVPAESGAKGLAIGSIASIGLAVVLGMALVVAAFSTPGSPQSTVLLLALLIATVLVALAAHILYLLFLRGVAVYLGNRSLAGRVIAYLVASLVLLVVSVGIFFLLIRAMMVMPGRDPRGIQIMMNLVQGVVGLGMMGWYVNLVAQVRDTVAQMGRPWRNDSPR